MGNKLLSWGSSSYSHTFEQTVRCQFDQTAREQGPQLFATFGFQVVYGQEKRTELDPTHRETLAQVVRELVVPLLQHAVDLTNQFGPGELQSYEWRRAISERFAEGLAENGFALQGQLRLVGLEMREAEDA